MVDSNRDLHADLAVCEAATAGPWAARAWTVPKDDQFSVESEPTGAELATFWQGSRYPGSWEITAEEARSNAVFCAKARSGWPHAIERALAAEAENAELRRQLSELCPVADFDTLTSLRAEKAHMAECISELEAEVKRLRAALEAIKRRDAE